MGIQFHTKKSKITAKSVYSMVCSMVCDHWYLAIKKTEPLGALSFWHHLFFFQTSLWQPDRHPPWDL